MNKINFILAKTSTNSGSHSIANKSDLYACIRDWRLPNLKDIFIFLLGQKQKLLTENEGKKIVLLG